MKIGDRVQITAPWKLGFKPVEKEGVIDEIYSNGLCKVKIPLKYGGFRTVRGSLYDCSPVE